MVRRFQKYRCRLGDTLPINGEHLLVLRDQSQYLAIPFLPQAPEDTQAGPGASHTHYPKKVTRAQPQDDLDPLAVHKPLTASN